MPKALVRTAQVVSLPTQSDSGVRTGSVSVQALMSDESVARDGNIFRTAGIQLENFIKNPVCCFAHLDHEPPVGRWSDLVKRNGALFGTVTFTPADVYPFGALVGRLYAQRYMNAFSVAILPLHGVRSAVPERDGGLDITSCELLSCDAVPIPALQTSLVTARSFGVDTRAAAAWAERQLDQGLTGSALAKLCAVRKAAITPPMYFFTKGI